MLRCAGRFKVANISTLFRKIILYTIFPIFVLCFSHNFVVVSGLADTSEAGKSEEPNLSTPSTKIIGKKIYSAVVFDHEGRKFKISDMLGKKPVIISPIYTSCPMACSLITQKLKELVSETGGLGEKFLIISFSFDERDNEEDLLTFKRRWDIDGENWKIVSAEKDEIDKFLSSLDFKIWQDPETGEILHPNYVFFINPDGEISGFANPFRLSPKDFKIAVERAGKGEVFGLISRIISKLYRYNPVSGKYEIDMKFVAQIIIGISIFLGFLMYFLVGKIAELKNRKIS